MKRHIIPVALSLTMIAGMALAGQAYDKTEKTDDYTLRLRVPAAAMQIAPVKTEIMKRFDAAAKDLKDAARQDKADNPKYFHPYALDMHWRVTFQSPQILSLSNSFFQDMGGAHPTDGYDSIVWDKSANRAVPIDALFTRADAKTALRAITDAALKRMAAIYKKRAGEAPDPDMMAMARQSIAPDAAHLKPYVLTHAKGQAKANGILLLYGAGVVWPHAVGRFLIAVPAKVFARYLTPAWRSRFRR